jgi:hypothetical protein
MNKLRDYYDRNTDPSLQGKKIPDLTLKDAAKIPKQAALTASLIPGIAGAAVADVGVNAKNFIKDKLETRRQLKSLPEEFSEPVDMSTPRPPRRELNEDQKRSIAREAERRSTFGSTQDQRDRAARGMKKGGAVKMAKGGSVSSASKRADGCAVRGKTKGLMV